MDILNTFVFSFMSYTEKLIYNLEFKGKVNEGNKDSVLTFLQTILLHYLASDTICKIYTFRN